jgi:hypothetical protein
VGATGDGLLQPDVIRMSATRQKSVRGIAYFFRPSTRAKVCVVVGARGGCNASTITASLAVRGFALENLQNLENLLNLENLANLQNLENPANLANQRT